ncbi:hypothetical protein JHK87_040213 [Glycine soja]|nr:hypothetical protein JHK87_040213 [Glycine soja]
MSYLTILVPNEVQGLQVCRDGHCMAPPLFFVSAVAIPYFHNHPHLIDKKILREAKEMKEIEFIRENLV